MTNKEKYASLQLFNRGTTSKEVVWNDADGIILASIKTDGDEDILTYHEYGSKYDPTSVITHEFVKRDHVKIWSKYGKKRMDVSDDTFRHMIEELNVGFIPKEFLDNEEYEIDENRRRITRDFDGEWGTVIIYRDDFDDKKYSKETYIYNKNLLSSLLDTYKNKASLVPFFTIISQTLDNDDTFNRTIYHCVAKGTMEEFEEFIKNPYIPEDNIIMKETLTNMRNGQSHYTYDVDYKYRTDEISPEEIYNYNLIFGATKVLSGYRSYEEWKNRYSNVADIFLDGDKYKFDIKDINRLLGAPSFTSVFSDVKALLSRYMGLKDTGVIPEVIFNGIYRSHLEYKNYMISTLVVHGPKSTNLILHGTLHREYLKVDYSKKSDTMNIIDPEKNPYIDQININPNVFVYDFKSKKGDMIDYHIRLVLGMKRNSNNDNNAIMKYNNQKHIIYLDQSPFYVPETDPGIKEYMDKTGKELFQLYDTTKNSLTHIHLDDRYMKMLSVQLETSFKIKNFTVSLNSVVSEYSERRLTIQEDGSDIVFEFYNNTMTIRKGKDIKISVDNENREIHFCKKDHTRKDADIQYDISHVVDYRTEKGINEYRFDMNFDNTISIKKSDISRYDIRRPEDRRKIATTDVELTYHFNSFLKETKQKKSDKDEFLIKDTVISIYDRDISKVMNALHHIRDDINRSGGLDKINEEYIKMKKIIPDMMKMLFFNGNEFSPLYAFYLMNMSSYSPSNKYPNSRDMFCLDTAEVRHPNYWVNEDRMFRIRLDAKVMGFMDSTMFVMDRIITDTDIKDFKKIFNFI